MAQFPRENSAILKHQLQASEIPVLKPACGCAALWAAQQDLSMTIAAAKPRQTNPPPSVLPTGMRAWECIPV